MINYFVEKFQNYNFLIQIAHFSNAMVKKCLQIVCFAEKLLTLHRFK